eukprot:Platyproteum_vivax@DN1726_c0_g1_i1.p1
MLSNYNVSVPYSLSYDEARLENEVLCALDNIHDENSLPESASAAGNQSSSSSCPNCPPNEEEVHNTICEKIAGREKCELESNEPLHLNDLNCSKSAVHSAKKIAEVSSLNGASDESLVHNGGIAFDSKDEHTIAELQHVEELMSHERPMVRSASVGQVGFSSRPFNDRRILTTSHNSLGSVSQCKSWNLSRMSKTPKSTYIEASDVLEEQEAERGRQAVQDAIKRNSRSMDKALHACRYRPVRSNKPLTTPEDFSFASARRPKAIEAAMKRVDAELESVSSIEQIPDSKWKAHQITKPEPFVFHSNFRQREAKEKEHEPYVPLAEQVRQYNAREPRMDHVPLHKSKLTKPKEFSFLSRPRKTSTMVSTEEQELAEMEAHKFHARKLNPKVLKPDLSIQNVSKKESTSNYDCKKVKTHLDDMTTISNMRHRGRSGYTSTESSQTRKLSAPAGGKRVALRQPPTSQKDIKEQKDGKAGTKRSQSVGRKAPTVPQPFNLQVEKRGRIHTQEMDRHIQMEEIIMKGDKMFTALPLPNLNKQHKLPNVAVRPVTESQEIQLCSEIRSQLRKEYEDEVAVIREKEELERSVQEERMRVAEERELKAWRAQAVPKASPVPVGLFDAQQCVPSKSEKVLTLPESPRLVSKERANRQDAMARST